LVSYAQKYGVTLLGPGAAGVATPGECNIGEMSESSLRPGKIGVLTKSGSLCGEVLRFMWNKGIGQSTVCAIGGGLVTGLRLKDVLKMFQSDPETSQIVMLGEVGGTDEIEAGEIIGKSNKPVIAYVAGHYAPPGVRMGHAGAILGDVNDGADYKSNALKRAGALTAATIAELFEFIENV
jgi:succinyl-CoA synthetase alpha subunit